MLDGIEDPFNHGQAVRALFAAGVDGLVVRRSWETALAVVTRASAGASELMPTATAVGSGEGAAEVCHGGPGCGSHARLPMPKRSSSTRPTCVAV